MARFAGTLSRPFCAPRFPFLRLERRTTCARRSMLTTSSPKDAVRRPDHTASQWLDLAEGRLRLDRLRRNGVGKTFFPCRQSRHSSRGKKLSPPPSSAVLRPASGCVVDRLRPADRNRGAGGRGLETAKEK